MRLPDRHSPPVLPLKETSLDSVRLATEDKEDTEMELKDKLTERIIAAAILEIKAVSKLRT
jgi:hypothetical protein